MYDIVIRPSYFDINIEKTAFDHLECDACQKCAYNLATISIEAYWLN